MARVDENATLLQERASDQHAATENAERGTVSSKSCWINGVYLCAKASCFLLLLNLIFIAVNAGLASNYPENGRFSTWAIIYRGSCTLSSRWDTVLHLIINILSSSILAASNYCMQTLVAPSREQIDKYHSRCQWLDIGNASVRNLRAIGRYRLALWAVLMVSATPFHVLYNSLIFQTWSATEFGIVVGPSDLSSENIWKLTTPALEKCFASSAYSDSPSLGWHEFASNIARGNYERLSTQQCFDMGNGPTPVGTKALVALAEKLTVDEGGNASILLTGLWYNQPDLPNGMPLQHKSIYAVPFSNQSYGVHGFITTCNSNPLSWGVTDNEAPEPYRIQECLAIKAEEHCQLLYSPPICIVIALATSVKVVAMFLAARVSRSKSAPLLTVGDAVASFLTRPDPSTEKLCWVSKTDIQRGCWESSKNHEPTYKQLPRRKRWMEAPGTLRWLTTLILWFACIGAGVYFFYVVSERAEVQTSLRYTNQVFSSSPALISPAQWNLMGSLVLANTPQLLITVSYYYYNSVLTSMLASAEYSSYGISRKPLRVTWPVKGSQQRSTYWLNIPYLYGVPILLMYMVLHWLVSQSVFYLVFIPYNVRGQPYSRFESRSISYSNLPILCSCVVGFVMVFILIGLAFRKLKSVMPLAGSCSAAISAACHPPRDENLDTATLGQIMWGETITRPAWMTVQFDENGDQSGHCSFTSMDTVTPSLTKLYT